MEDKRREFDFLLNQQKMTIRMGSFGQWVATEPVQTVRHEHSYYELQLIQKGKTQSGSGGAGAYSRGEAGRFDFTVHLSSYKNADAGV